MAFPGKRGTATSQVAGRARSCWDPHTEPTSPAAPRTQPCQAGQPEPGPCAQRPLEEQPVLRRDMTDSAGRGRVFFSPQAGDDNGGIISAARDPDCKIIRGHLESDSPGKLCRALLGIQLSDSKTAAASQSHPYRTLASKWISKRISSIGTSPKTDTLTRGGCRESCRIPGQWHEPTKHF